MTSISEVQKRRVFEEITRLFFASGEQPRVIDVMGEISNYFAENPAGNPLSIPLNFVGEGLRSDVDKFNEILAKTTLNLDVLYDTSLGHIEDVMMLTTLLRTHIERLRARRKRLEDLVDDYLFSLYNTDGYYFSISDTFSDTTMTDLTLTEAFVDTSTGSITLPTISSLTQRLSAQQVIAQSVSMTVNDKSVAYETTSDFSGAIDHLSNTVWSVEVKTSEPREAIMVLTLTVGTQQDPVRVSRIEFDPYGISPVQMFVEVISETSVTTNVYDFGSQIQTSAGKMVFVDNPRDIQKIRITLRKAAPDYNTIENDTIKYRYIFGAKDINITEHVYDSEAIFVSQPLQLASDLREENVIDAVSLVVEDHIPPNTNILYYVAADVDDDSPSISDFNWKRIEPLGEGTGSVGSIVKFDGALTYVKYIRPDPTPSEIQLIELDSTASDPKELNPTPAYIDGVDIYRIAEFEEEILKESLTLEEGINTTKILHIDLDDDAIEGLEFWKPYVNGTSAATVAYGTIDSGDEFFYGGDVGDDGRSVYVETYLESLSSQELVIKEFRKVDSNSKTWDVKVFLNGREVGNLPTGTDKLRIPWKFQEGLNHICLLINIPAANDTYQYPYVGSLDLMDDSDLFDFGSVKLSNWTYVDFFQMQYNETGEPKTFTIHDGQIISRRKPTTNYRFKYSTPTNSSPEGIRIRADLSRSVQNAHVTPSIAAYRVRFLYGENA